MASPIKDADWVKTSFMLPKFAADRVEARSLAFSNAALKVTDTTLGGNFAINPPPQFTRHADPRVRGRYSPSTGMGRKYSEMLDDNSQLIHLRFGVPEFNSLTTFFTGFYDSSAATLSRTGRAPGFFYSLGKAAGFVVTLPLAPLILAGHVYRFLANKPASKYYYMKPTMPLYWNAVQSIANGIAVNMGIVPRVWTTDTNAATNNKTNPEIEAYNSGEFNVDDDNYTTDDVHMYHRLMPDLFMEGGGIDIYAVANRGQRLADAARRKAIEAVEQAGNDAEKLRKNMQDYINETVTAPTSHFKATSGSGAAPGFETYLAAWNRESASQPPASKDAAEDANANRSWYDDFVTFSEAEIRDGGQFVTFRVNHTGTASESISTSTSESELAQRINGTSSDARSKRFSFADGAIGIPGVDQVFGAVKDTVSGFLDGVQLSGLAALFGNAFVDIPEQWQDTITNAPTASYDIELRSPYGNKLSRFMNLWVPLSMLLAGALPKSTGKHSYDSPFLCQIFDKGRAQIRLGIIDSLSITRGVGNLGWTREHEPLGIDVSFSVKDLSSVLHMPINSSPGLFDEDNAYTDYLAVLGSLSMVDQIYVTNRLRLNLTRQMVEFKKWTSPAKWGNWAAGTLPGQAISAFARVTDRP